jgi:hypothetical protein
VVHWIVLRISAEYAALKPKRRDGGGDLQSRLHMGAVTRDGHGDLAEKLHMSKVSRPDARKDVHGHEHHAGDKWERLGDEEVSCALFRVWSRMGVVPDVCCAALL